MIEHIGTYIVYLVNNLFLIQLKYRKSLIGHVRTPFQMLLFSIHVLWDSKFCRFVPQPAKFCVKKDQIDNYDISMYWNVFN